MVRHRASRGALASAARPPWRRLPAARPTAPAGSSGAERARTSIAEFVGVHTSDPAPDGSLGPPHGSGVHGSRKRVGAVGSGRRTPPGRRTAWRAAGNSAPHPDQVAWRKDTVGQAPSQRRRPFAPSTVICCRPAAAAYRFVLYRKGTGCGEAVLRRQVTPWLSGWFHFHYKRLTRASPPKTGKTNRGIVIRRQLALGGNCLRAALCRPAPTARTRPANNRPRRLLP